MLRSFFMDRPKMGIPGAKEKPYPSRTLKRQPKAGSRLVLANTGFLPARDEAAGGGKMSASGLARVADRRGKEN